MKQLLLIFSVLIATSAMAQKISFSNQIVNSKDENIVAIRDEWKLYLVDCVKAYIKKDTQSLNKYWNNVDIETKNSLIAIFQISDKIPLCFYGEMVTYDITKLDNDFYRIKTLALLADTISKGVAANFTLFAKVKNKEVEFCSYFQKIQPTLKTFSTKYIEYFYPADFGFNNNEAMIADEFYNKLISDFKVEKKEKVTYIVAKDLDSANNLIGFEYSIRSSTSKDAGYYIQRSNMMFSSQIAHKHELVHAVLESKYPNAPRLFHEGIATYLGGTNGQEYEYHAKQLEEIAKSQNDIDFSKFDEWDKNIDDKTNPFYTIGAIIIDYAYKTGGQEKVEALFTSQNEVSVTIENELGIEKGEINTFIKSYLSKLSIKN